MSKAGHGRRQRIRPLGRVARIPASWRLGPGLLTGIADEDPSNIATYSHVGAAFGYRLLWSVWLFYPLVAAVQEISGRIGRTTGQGLAANLRDHYPGFVSILLVVMLLIANVINIGADLIAMGSGVSLVAGGSRLLYASGFALLSVGLEVFIEYDRYARFLKWGSITLLAYVATAFSVHVSWPSVGYGLIPRVLSDPHFAMAMVAIAGTTISPYLFFWQSGQEVEIERETPGQKPLAEAPRQAPGEIRRIRFDTYFGMGLSQMIAFFILVTAAATLNTHGLTHIETARQAATALKPLAGRFTFLLFSLGLVATGLLAVPAFAGSCAYALSDLMRWPYGLASRPRKASGFYLIIAVATLAGLALDGLGINSMRALYLSAVLNGITAVPIMGLMLRLARRPDVMGRLVLQGPLLWTGWAATLLMAASVAVFALQSV
ncbi:MAG: NRAMP family divalent metal transporter [Acidiferrobacteraceae bacterium]